MKRYIQLPERVGVAVACLLLATQAMGDDYGDARAELIAAYQAQDYATMVTAAEKALLARPGHPGAMFNLALANTLNGNPEAALGNFMALVMRDVDFGVSEMDEFAALRELPGWAFYQERVAELNAPVGTATVALRLDEDRYVPEGIAIDKRGNIYLGSIRYGELRRGEDVLSRRQGHWSVFGMRFHDDGGLWFASAAVAQLEDVGEDLGKTGLFRLDVNTGTVTRAAILPQYAEQQVLGDLVIDGDTIYTTDSLTGAVYAYDIKANRFKAIVERGVLRSPQGLVLDESGKRLYVADYSTGLYVVTLSTGELEKLQVIDHTPEVGIDGLYRRGDELIAIQNGIRPHRVATFRLMQGGAAEVATRGRTLASNLPEFDEPTLGAMQGDDFYFVANSHWNRFDAENRLPDGLTGPIILELSLSDKQ